jgi:hypothetical protein
MGRQRMLTLGFLALSVALVPVGILFALGRVWTLELVFIRLAWVPLLALALQLIAWRPMARALGYGFLLPPLLTCVVSLFFGIVGATLLAARPRAERPPGLVLSTIVAATPGILLVLYIAFSVTRFFVTSHGFR